LAYLLIAPLFAVAQTNVPDPPICNGNLREWSRIASGGSLAPLESLLARTPPACRSLRAQISDRIAALRSAPVREPAQPPAPAADPCATALTQWVGLTTSRSTLDLEAFIATTPERCNAEREAARARLEMLQNEERASAAQRARVAEDESAIRRVLIRPSIAALEEYLTAHPNGRWRNFAQGAKDFIRNTCEPDARHAELTGFFRTVNGPIVSCHTRGDLINGRGFRRFGVNPNSME